MSEEREHNFAVSSVAELDELLDPETYLGSYPETTPGRIPSTTRRSAAETSQACSGRRASDSVGDILGITLEWLTYRAANRPCL